MPLDGLKTDIELLFLVLSAGALSYLVSGEILSNVLFTFLLSSLFFLIGLHIDLGFFKAVRTKGSQIGFAMLSVYALVPAIAYIFSFLPGNLGEAFLVLGASGAALSSPKIWSNKCKADGDLASYTGSFSVLTSLLFVPVILMIFPIDVNFSLMIDNLVFVAAPFVIGLMSQNYDNTVIKDLRVHFSKLAFWLITLITFLQAKVILQADGVIYLSQLVVVALFFAAFSVLTFGYSHLIGILSGFYEKESRAIGFISSSRNVAIGFFIALHVSPEAVLLVGVYYFVRQIMGALFVDLYLHDETKILERISF